jgi:SpoIID/LytB domain protein
MRRTALATLLVLAAGPAGPGVRTSSLADLANPKVRTPTMAVVQAFRPARPDAVQAVPPAGAEAAEPRESTTRIRIGALNGSSYTLTEVPLEPYVAAVLTGEAAPNTPPQTLEALAIAVRTYTLANLGRHRAEGFDLCDQTHCQVMRTGTPATERAAQATAGQVLLDNGLPATVYYSASCGGHTEIPSAVWPGAADLPHLPSRPDDACRGTPAWTAELAAADLQRSLDAAGYRGTLESLRIVSRNASGRVTLLALDGVTPDRISGQDLRFVVGGTLGWRRILSTAFELRRIDNVYRFTGRGSGHGVGMCVIGAMHLGEAGQSASTILGRYYPGLPVGPFVPRVMTSVPAPPPGVAVPAPPPASAPASSVRPSIDLEVVIPGGRETDRSALAAIARRAGDELSSALGVSPPAALALRFHETADDYERATGAPWFTSTVRVGNDLHFLPLAVLRDRGVLERAIRRGLVHVLINPTLSGQPLWISHGAALYYSDPPPVDSSPRAPRVSCPSDLELQRPASAGALSDAYARARACFARQIASGRSWREVR